MTYARAGGGAFPAVRDVGLIGVVGVAQQRAGGWSATTPRGTGFTELDSTFLFHAVVRCGRLTPLWMSHPWGDILADYRNNTDLVTVCTSGKNTEIWVCLFKMWWSKFWRTIPALTQRDWGRIFLRKRDSVHSWKTSSSYLCFNEE